MGEVPLYRRYAKTAKKIDIKALKENLWDSITEVRPPLCQAAFGVDLVC